jgi:hypothetical protein
MGCGTCGADFGVEPVAPIRPRRLNEPLDTTLNACTVLGGSGFPLAPGDIVSVTVTDEVVAVLASKGLIASASVGSDLIGFGASGPGAVTSGYRFSFFFNDFESFAKGFVVTEVLNRLLSRTKIHTLLTITTATGELFLHYGGEDPGALRVRLSPLFTSLRLAGADDG